MLVSIHQPHYLPWLRYVEKVVRSDVFVVLDDCQYEKNGFQNRNKIKTAQGWTCLTVPVQKPTQRLIRDIEIDNRGNWQAKHRRALEMSYSKAPFFELYWGELEALYAEKWTRLGDLCRVMLAVLFRQLRITTRVVWSSDLPTQGQASQRLVEICRAVGASTYLSGAFALEQYVDAALFRAAGIRLAVQQWHAPQYSQLYPAAGFIPDLSVVDLLFNEGPRSREILLAAGGVTYPADDREVSGSVAGETGGESEEGSP
jgi:hypothetical protein